jgi:hypothetical protein
MAARSYYEVLEVAPTAPPDEIRRAFRRGIARYHPDKVQHLGSEIRNIAADRAAECTEAYRTLSDPRARAEYDARVGGLAEVPRSREWGFGEDRARADELVRQAALGRVRDALEQVFGPCEEPPASGFDVACTPPKRELWRRSLRPRVLGRLVTEIDAREVEESWLRAMRLGRGEPREMCVILMGPTTAPDLRLRETVEEMRRRPTPAGVEVTVVPINITTWSANVPADAPAALRPLLRGLLHSA